MSPANEAARLQVDFIHYWHVGSGRGNGNQLDAVCARDADGLPVLPGRQLKGLLRHAVRRAEAWGWMEGLALPSGPLQGHEQLLFGSSSQQEGRFSTEPGALLVDCARLPANERAGLAAPGNADLRGELFGELFSTAIDELGSARRFSLRGLEVSIPLQLHAALKLEVTAVRAQLRAQQRAYIASGSAWTALERALPLLDALGAQRSRGLGEARVVLIRAENGGKA